MSLSDTWRLHHAPLSAAFSGRDGRQAWLGRLRLEDYEIVAKRLVGTLSAPELQVLQCLVSGMSNKGIAVVAGLSMVDVERIRATTMNKLSAKSTADAIRVALYAGLDQPL
jgi:FixJ family two-component response regulator